MIDYFLKSSLKIKDVTSGFIIFANKFNLFIFKLNKIIQNTCWHNTLPNSCVKTLGMSSISFDRNQLDTEINLASSEAFHKIICPETEKYGQNNLSYGTEINQTKIKLMRQKPYPWDRNKIDRNSAYDTKKNIHKSCPWNKKKSYYYYVNLW